MRTGVCHAGVLLEFQVLRKEIFEMKKLLIWLLMISFAVSMLLPAGTAFAADAPGTRNDARAINVNKSYSDNIKDKYDVDFYQFTLDAAGTVNLTFTRQNMSKDQEYWSAKIFDSKTNEICAFSFNGVDETTNTYLVGLPAGTFYLRITGGNFYENSGYCARFFDTAYTFCLNFEKTDFAEKENNDSFTTASSVFLNRDYRGSVNDKYDKDFYQFTLSAAGTVSITFSRPYLGNNNEYWYAVVYDTSTREIFSCSFSGVYEESYSCLVGLPAGTFYLRITGGNFYENSGYCARYNVSTYSFCLNYEKTNYAEKENNEAFSGASQVSLNRDYRGSVNDKYDNDYYKFTLSAAGTVSITFSRPYLGYSEEYWYAKLFNNSTQEICSYSFNGTNTETNTYTVGLPAGTFYLRITGGSFYENSGYCARFSSKTYTFCLNFEKTEYAEKENNETAAQATPSSVDRKYQGSINDQNDVDWYRLTLSGRQNVILKFEHKAVSDSQDYWKAELFDDQMDSLATESFSGTESSALRGGYTLSAGTYFLKISGGGYSGSRYSSTPYYLTFVAKGFIDVPGSAYYADAVDWAVKNGITSGTAPFLFSPEAGCTRAQVVTFLWRAAGSPKPKILSSPFIDVKKGSYYYDAVQWAVQKNITTGTDATHFSPDDICTRGQVVTFLRRFRENPKPKSSSNPFIDVKKGSFFYQAVLWAVQQNITKGTDSTHFSPNDTCTRAQVVTFLYRTMVR